MAKLEDDSLHNSRIPALCIQAAEIGHTPHSTRDVNIRRRSRVEGESCLCPMRNEKPEELERHVHSIAYANEMDLSLSVPCVQKKRAPDSGRNQ